jgi:hypothetical protein
VNVAVVVLMLNGRRWSGQVMCFVVAVDNDHMTAMVICRPEMHVLGGKRCQHGQAQGRNCRRQSTSFTT